MGDEKRLESIIAADIGILGLGPLMLLGRQIVTDQGSRIDLLALDRDGTLYVVELKRDRTPRETVAQVLDYGAWVRRLSAERLAHLFETGPFANSRTLNAAFDEQFEQPLPEIINESHRLVIVASVLDQSTERIVEYLLDDYGVPINVVLFRYFQDGQAEYLGRSWLRDPDVAEQRTRAAEIKRPTGEWNGEDYYVHYGPEDGRSWNDARQYGYISAGGGRRWSTPLFRLHPGARVFVHDPPYGYVGVGRVVADAVPIGDFTVTVEGEERSLLEVPLRNEKVKENAEDPDLMEYVVRVQWEQAVPTTDGYWERGFFSRRGTTAIELRDPNTSAKICAHFGLEAAAVSGSAVST
jgi:hypothetical protein